MQTSIYVANAEDIDYKRTAEQVRKASYQRWERLERMPVQAAKSAAAAYALLLYGLNARFGMSQIPEISYTADGKPLFLSGVEFSLSHTRRHSACAISDGPVGCDIETVRPVGDKVPPRVLSDAEYELYCRSGNKDRFFIRLWTLKESYVKLTGEGLSAGLKQLSFESGGLEGSDCRFQTYEYQDCCISVASARGPFPERPEVVSLEEMYDFI